MNIMDSVFKEIRKIITSLKIKYENVARELDTLDIRRNYDRFLVATRREDTFNSYRTFDEQAVANSRITVDKELIEAYANNPSLIPVGQRNVVLEAQRKFIIDNYEEENDYYRTLNGLPPYEEETFIYASGDFYIDNQIEFKPVHELTEGEFVRLRETGEWSRLVKENPDKEYLEFLGTEAIDIIIAREASNFQILKMSRTSNNDTLLEQFGIFYEQNRSYMMSVLYVRDHAKRYDLYDRYMAMMLLVMVIQRLLVTTFKNGIEREFYDPITLSLLFESYNVPFIENLPLEVQQLLAKNLNKLLHYKSTDRVIYDIASILGFERARIFKYLMIKEHRHDDDGNPIFKYKEVENEKGIKEIVEDREAMYELYFKSVSIEERNTLLALSSESGKISYDEMVSSDGYWWKEDPEIMRRLYEEEFNYIDTKYISMSMMYRLTDMMFETTHFLRMILDRKSMTRRINVSLPRLSKTSELSFFETVVALNALVCKKFGFEGNIFYSPTKILSVMGFDFQYGFRKFIQGLPKKYRKLPYIARIERSIVHMDAKTSNDINALYDEIKLLREILEERIGETRDRDEYNILQELWKGMFYTENNKNVFKLNDGTNAKTYMDFLEEFSPDVHSEINLMEEEEDIDTMIKHITHRLEVEVDSLKSLHILSEGEDSLTEALVKLIMFFKSYTVDLTSFNILYVFDSRHLNSIKLLDRIQGMEGTSWLKDADAGYKFLDTLYLSSHCSLPKDKLNINDDLSLEVFLEGSLKYVILRDLIYLIESEMNVSDANSLHRIMDIMALKSKMDLHHGFKYRENVTLDSILEKMETHINLNDLIKVIDGELHLVDTESLHNIIDDISLFVSRVFDDNMNYQEELIINSVISVIHDELKLREDITLISKTTASDNMSIYDSLSKEGFSYIMDKLDLEERLDFEGILHVRDDKVNIEDSSLIESDIDSYDEIGYYEEIFTRGNVMNLDRLSIREIVHTHSLLRIELRKMLMKDNVFLDTLLDSFSNVSFIDALDIETTTTVHDECLKLKDTLDVVTVLVLKNVEMDIRDKLSLQGFFTTDKKMEIYDDLLLNISKQLNDNGVGFSRFLKDEVQFQ